MRSNTLKLGVGMTALTLVLAACGSSSSGSDGAGAPAGELEIFSWWTSGGEAAALKTLTDAFEAESGAGFTNAMVAGGGGGNAQQVLQTRVQGGDAPDTWMAGPGGRINSYIDAGVLADINDVYEAEGFYDTIPEVVTESMSRDGKVYGIAPGAHRSNVLWYNKDLLADNGIEVPDDYASDTFLSDMEKLKDAGVTPLCLGAKDTFGTVQLFQNILLGAVGEDAWYEMEGGVMTGGPDWKSPEVAEAAQTFLDVVSYAGSDSGALSWDQAAGRLGSGECAFFSMGDWAYGELLNGGFEDGKDFGYTAYPDSAGSYILIVDAWVASATSPEEDLAMDWMKVLGDADTQIAFNAAKGSTPLRNDVDPSELPAYQQEAYESVTNDTLEFSVVDHGDTAFITAMYDAVIEFMQSKDVDKFTTAMDNAAGA